MQCRVTCAGGRGVVSPDDWAASYLVFQPTLKVAILVADWLPSLIVTFTFSCLPFAVFGVVNASLAVPPVNDSACGITLPSTDGSQTIFPLVSGAPVSAFRVELSDEYFNVEFTGKDIRARIPERFNDFVGDQRRFVIDIENKRVLVPMVIWNIRDKLISLYDTTYGARGANLLTALLPFLHGMPDRRLRDATGYAIEPRQPSGLIARMKHDC